MISKSSIEQLVNTNIHNEKIYQQAFMHKSASQETLESNERLEFIGDSVLGLVVTSYLYEKYPNENEGFLTRIRTKLVSGKALSKIAENLHFYEYITMNEKGMKNEWFKNPRILEDSLEAFIGSIYLDVGITAAKDFVYTNIITKLDNESLLEDNNYKDILMRYVQGRKLNLPEYRLNETVNDNNRLFTVQVFLQGKLVSEGTHKIKKQAEQISAKRTLQCFNIIK